MAIAIAKYVDVTSNGGGPVVDGQAGPTGEAEVIGVAIGSSVVLGVGQSLIAGMTTGQAIGVSAVNGVGRANKLAVGSALGAAAAPGIGRANATAAGQAPGTCVVTGVGSGANPLTDTRMLVWSGDDYATSADTGWDYDDMQSLPLKSGLRVSHRVLDVASRNTNGTVRQSILDENVAIWTADYNNKLAALGTYPAAGAYPPPAIVAAESLVGSPTVANATTGIAANSAAVTRWIALMDANPTGYVLMTAGGGSTDLLQVALQRPDLQPRMVWFLTQPLSGTNHDLDANAAEYILAQQQVGGTLANLACLILCQDTMRGIYINSVATSQQPYTGNPNPLTPPNPIYSYTEMAGRGFSGNRAASPNRPILGCGNGGLKAADSPGLLYLFKTDGTPRTNASLIDPTQPSLGGTFQAHATIPKRFVDIPTGQTVNGLYPGSKTIYDQQSFIWGTFYPTLLAPFGVQPFSREWATRTGKPEVGVTQVGAEPPWIRATPTAVQYQWFTWGTDTFGYPTYTPIVGATSINYLPVTGNIGARLVFGCRGAATDGYGEWAYSIPSSLVVAAGQPATYDTNAVAYFAAMTVQPSEAFKEAIDGFIRYEKLYGLWTYADDYAFGCTEQAQHQLVKLKSAGLMTRVTVAGGGMPFSAMQGYSFIDGGNTGYIDTGFSPTATAGAYPLRQMSSSDIGMLVDVRSTNLGTPGTAAMGQTNLLLSPRSETGVFSGRAFSASGTGSSPTAYTTPGTFSFYYVGPAVVRLMQGARINEGSRGTSTSSAPNIKLGTYDGVGISPLVTGMNYWGRAGGGSGGGEKDARHIMCDKNIRALNRTLGIA